MIPIEGECFGEVVKHRGAFASEPNFGFAPKAFSDCSNAAAVYSYPRPLAELFLTSHNLCGDHIPGSAGALLIDELDVDSASQRLLGRIHLAGAESNAAEVVLDLTAGDCIVEYEVDRESSARLPKISLTGCRDGAQAAVVAEFVI